jgi:hypothetical protein
VITTADAIRILGGPRAEALARETEAAARSRRAAAARLLADIKRPVTLRDVRRVWSHEHKTYPRDRGGYLNTARTNTAIYMVAGIAFAVLSGDLSHWPKRHVRVDVIDRLISRYGPDFRLDPYLDEYLQMLDRVSDAILDLVVSNMLERVRSGQELEHVWAGVSVNFGMYAHTDYLPHEAYQAAERELARRQDHTTGTDRVVQTPVGVANADAHGGDGNSGEVAHRAQTSAPDRDGCESAACDAAADTPDGTPEGTGAGTNCSNAGGRTATDGASAREGEGTPTGQGDDGGENPTGEMGSHLSGTQTAADKGAAGNGFSAEGDGTGAGQDSSAAAAQAQGESQSIGAADAGAASGSTSESVVLGDAESPADAYSDGGQHLSADPMVCGARERRAMRETADLLRRIIETEIGARGRETPRVDARTLVREIVSRRCAIGRARRHEADIRELVLAVDESGSCSAVVNTLYATALTIARNLPSGKASVLLHSNGYCVRVADGAPCAPWLKKEIALREHLLSRHYYAVSQQAASADIWRAVAKRRPGLVLAMGDHDADWMLEIMSDAGTNTLAIHHHAVAPGYGGVRRIGPVRDAMSAAASLKSFIGW